MSHLRDETIAEWLERTDRQAAEREVKPHVVYRAFDTFGLLLYVGCTVNAKSRMATHRGGSPWYRYAETIAYVEYPTRTEARAAEKLAIDTEASYFNSTQADIQRTQANKNAAKRSLWAQDWYRPIVDLDFRAEQEAWDAAWDEMQPECDAWDRALRATEARLKGGAFPYMTDADRLSRYLAAREDAALALLEAAA